MIEVGHGMTDRASFFLNLAVLCPVLIRHGNLDQFCEKMFHLGSRLAARGVLTEAELGKLVPYFGNGERSSSISREKTWAFRSWTIWCGLVGAFTLEQFLGVLQGR